MRYTFTIAKILVGVIIILLIVIGIDKATGFTNGITRAFNNLFNDGKTELGPVVIKDIAPTQKLKVLTMTDEILVSQYWDIEHNKIDESLADSSMWEKLKSFVKQSANKVISYEERREIHIIYPSRLDFGYDFSKYDQPIFEKVGDTAIVTLPPVEILNKEEESIDDAHKRIPIRIGQWSDHDMQDFADRAKAIMKRKCEIARCYDKAEELGQKLVLQMIKALGYENVIIKQQLRKSYGKYIFKDEYQKDVNKNKGKFMKFNELPYIQYKNGDYLLYNSDIDYDILLAFSDVFNVYFSTTSNKRERAEVIKDNYHYFLTFPPYEVEAGTPECEKLVGDLEKEDYSKFINDIQNSVMDEGYIFHFVAVDRNWQNIYEFKSKEMDIEQ